MITIDSLFATEYAVGKWQGVHKMFLDADHWIRQVICLVHAAWSFFFYASSISRSVILIIEDHVVEDTDQKNIFLL